MSLAIRPTYALRFNFLNLVQKPRSAPFRFCQRVKPVQACDHIARQIVTLISAPECRAQPGNLGRALHHIGVPCTSVPVGLAEEGHAG